MNASLLPLDAFAQRMLAGGAASVPVLVTRLPELERRAWRSGLRAARGLERRAAAAFASAAGVVLRAHDLLAHDAGSDVFVAGLLAGRGGDVTSGAVPIDARSALARIAAALESATGLEVHTGWTLCDLGPPAPAMDDVVERALARGVQERERYAFFSALGHELRTPLSSIRGYLETLLDENVDQTTRRRFLRIAYDESLRMSRLVEGMFEISLLDMNPSGSSRSIGSLQYALEAARDACAANASVRGVGIEIDGTPAVAVAIDGDRLTLVLVNLIDNAIKHGRAHGGVFVSVDVEDKGFVRVTVDDDGPGIAPADRGRVFAFGERAVTVAKGTGIGLAFARLLLERAGGHMALEESPRGGARFVLSVPRV
ncbi:MAG: integral rane sensor signal transduction histidine kinase [Candidatus Eremiobacteraeota bacterium]|nr:integral rane sensor signal transduction histidine kinase [Candidatus Eremiobacteraeota bacterium]